MPSESIQQMPQSPSHSAEKLARMAELAGMDFDTLVEAMNRVGNVQKRAIEKRDWPSVEKAFEDLNMIHDSFADRVRKLRAESVSRISSLK